MKDLDLDLKEFTDKVTELLDQVQPETMETLMQCGVPEAVDKLRTVISWMYIEA